MEEDIFHGVSVGWMRSQWRDCADRVEQIQIFRDMTDATRDEILVALGEIQPEEATVQKKTRPEYTPEEDALIIKMCREGAGPPEIADALGRSSGRAVSIHMMKLRRQGVDLPYNHRGGRRPKGQGNA